MTLIVNYSLTPNAVVSSGARDVKSALSDQVVPASDNIKTIRIELAPKADAPFYGKWTIKPREVPAEEMKNGITLIAKRCASIEGKVIEEGGKAVTNIWVNYSASPRYSLLDEYNRVSPTPDKIRNYEDEEKPTSDKVLTDAQGSFRFDLIRSTNAVNIYLSDLYMEGAVNNIMPARQDGLVVIKGKRIYRQDVTISLWKEGENHQLERFKQYAGKYLANGRKGAGSYEDSLVDGFVKPAWPMEYGQYEFKLDGTKDIVILNPDITIPDDGPDIRLIVKAPDSVKFYVKDKFTGAPVTRAGISLKVTASGDSLYENSDDSGVATFSIKDIKLPVNIAIDHRDYLQYKQDDLLLTDNNQILLDPGFQFYGNVVNSEGFPVTNAAVALMRKNGRTRECGTDQKGQYRFTALEFDQAKIVVFAKGFARKVEAVELNEKASPHNITLEAGLEIIVDIEPTLREKLIKADPMGQIVVAQSGTFEIVSANLLSDAEAKGWVSPGAYDMYWANSYMNKAVKIHTTEIRTAGRIKCPQKTIAECKIMKAPIAFTIGGLPMR